MSNMYTGKSSRNPYLPFLYFGTIGVLLIGFGIYEYTELTAWELTEDPNEEYKMHQILWWVYDLGGKTTILVLFSLIGLGAIYAGFTRTKELKKLKDQVK